MLHVELSTLTVSLESTPMPRPQCFLETCLSARRGQSAGETGCLIIRHHSHRIQSLSLFLPFSLILLIEEFCYH